MKYIEIGLFALITVLSVIEATAQAILTKGVVAPLIFLIIAFVTGYMTVELVMKVKNEKL